MSGFRRSQVSWRLGVLPGAELHLRDGLRLCGGAVQDPQELLVADGLEGRGVPGQAALEQRAHLVQQARLHHLVHPPVDQGLHIRPVPELQADPDGVVPGRQVLLSPRCGRRWSSQSPGRPPAPGGCAWCPPGGAAPPPPGPPAAAPLEALRCPPGPAGPGASFRTAPPAQPPAKPWPFTTASTPQPGALPPGWAAFPGQDVLYDGDGRLGVPGGGPLLRRVGHGDHVVGARPPSRLPWGRRCRWSCPCRSAWSRRRPLPVIFLCQQDPQPRLAAGRGTHHADDLLAHRRPSSHRSRWFLLCCADILTVYDPLPGCKGGRLPAISRIPDDLSPCQVRIVRQHIGDQFLIRRSGIRVRFLLKAEQAGVPLQNGLILRPRCGRV